ncbi:sensor domain-containing diguanylate cyclase [Sulfuricurvum sp.]|uniref:sensor domain-containing diguanylate cyclase n=1 Tax=Sulfuricurvum sp. TaxID=2025608 RepID=UPI002612D599|nr:sensor domain-containing diguanylate cyclase [Sulfuricurvum sp.]
MDNFGDDSRNSECLISKDLSYHQILSSQKEKLIYVCECFGTSDEENAFEEYIYFCMHNDIPYLYVTSEVTKIAEALLANLADEQCYDDMKPIHETLNHLEYRISEEYYRQFLRKLSSKNHLRLAHLANLVEKHLMIHYQHHLEWMLVLVSMLEGTADPESHCEFNPTRCSFGQWLHNPSIPYIVNTSHFNDIQDLHILLHQLGEHILALYHSGTFEHKSMIQLLLRLDYTSLEIGNEIAIINDMLIIGEYTKDPMTGLLGRRLLDKIMMNQIEIAKATESNCSLIMCDLDYFKTINDQYGHLAGDSVIQNFAELLQKTLRKSDFIFRFGGEEFLILLPSSEYSEARSVAENLCTQASLQKVNFDGQNISYSVSIGTFGIDTDTISFVTKETIINYVKSVDAQLYLAKQNGRNRVE